jgi:hypothetical protein
VDIGVLLRETEKETCLADRAEVPSLVRNAGFSATNEGNARIVTVPQQKKQDENLILSSGGEGLLSNASYIHRCHYIV